MPKEYLNDSPAVRFLDRIDHLMRLQERALNSMYMDTENEHREAGNVTISAKTDAKHFVRETMARLARSRERFADVELMLQVFFCRHYDNFEIFLEELVGDIVRRNPTLLDGVRLRKVHQNLSADEKLEKRLENVARLPLYQLSETLRDEMSFELFVDDAAGNRIAYVSDVRNLLTHRYGIADLHFVAKQPSCGLKVGSRFVVTMEFTRDALQDMTDAAEDIQRRAEHQFKFTYETKVVGRTEWWEEPDVRLPKLPSPTKR